MLLATHVGGIELSNVDNGYAACLLDRGRIFDAKARAEDALEQLQRAGVTNDHARIEAWYVLAIINDAKGDRATAIATRGSCSRTPKPSPTRPHDDIRAALQREASRVERHCFVNCTVSGKPMPSVRYSVS